MRTSILAPLAALVLLTVLSGCMPPPGGPGGPGRPEPHPAPVIVEPAPEPVVIEAEPAQTAPAQTQQAQPETTTVIIHNPNGSRTPVTLTKVGPEQWKGPGGELYYGIPSEDRLRPAYGLK